MKPLDPNNRLPAFDAPVGKGCLREPLFVRFLRRFFPGTVRAICEADRQSIKDELRFALMCGPLSELDQRLNAVVNGLRVKPYFADMSRLKSEPPPEPPDPPSFLSDLKKT